MVNSEECLARAEDYWTKLLRQGYISCLWLNSKSEIRCKFVPKMDEGRIFCPFQNIISLERVEKSLPLLVSDFIAFAYGQHVEVVTWGGHVSFVNVAILPNYSRYYIRAVRTPRPPVKVIGEIAKSSKFLYYYENYLWSSYFSSNSAMSLPWWLSKPMIPGTIVSGSSRQAKFENSMGFCTMTSRSK